MDFEAFVNSEKALLIAPAGYGKTYTLSRCMEYTKGKSLVLTHTHAGVASIKQKLKDAGIHNSKYSVETITSFAQKYVDSFYIGDKPLQEDSTNYYPFLIGESASIFCNSVVENVLKITYSGMFVDEYQDCTYHQHLMLSKIMNFMPTRILGDPMQAIFNFNGELVNFDEHLDDFEVFPSLEVPHRWNQVGANELGDALSRIREQLKNEERIELENYLGTIEVVVAQERDLFNFRSDYCRTLNSLRREHSLLVIHPNSVNNAPRLKFSKMFKDISSIESIDDKDFYRLAKSIDNLDHTQLVIEIRDIAYTLFNKTGVNNWFNDKGFKNKKDGESKLRVIKLQRMVDSYSSIDSLKNILCEIKSLPDIDCVRIELFKSLLKSIDISILKGISVLEGMREQRNNIRRAGRRVEGKHIGTTLLTKGLEFDVVVILNAHKFGCPKHLYVALTRCRKKLVVITEDMTLSPYQ
ncbi:UvrD-helicase domain-containing protein [Pseudoalteromonas piratica]|uniref:DNA 3'-5' helicase II n=1 Tax=Pseudoalteromonas piratica TaxID=1348114 RepID=A0A0A7EJK9_9GAMM|nr:UvrD-helicase domain-containing protein [Pseudoalteromonas piratica]AIY66117.1 hypothetical protein OM33_14115 [Pseudoalteromonas piratica]